LLGFLVPHLWAPLPGGWQGRGMVEGDIFSLPKRCPHRRPLVTFFDPFEDMDELEFDDLIVGVVF
jgi:hypothetical protein